MIEKELMEEYLSDKKNEKLSKKEDNINILDRKIAYYFFAGLGFILMLIASFKMFEILCEIKIIDEIINYRYIFKSSAIGLYALGFLLLSFAREIKSNR